jgi:hypothetical protein
MKNLASIMCLTIAVLLGSAGVNYASSAENRDARSIWKGTEWEKRIDGWVYKIKFNDSGDQYSIKITGDEVLAPCFGRVKKDGTLSPSTCEGKYVIGAGPFVYLDIDGNVNTINLNLRNDIKDEYFGIETSVTFDELKRRLAGLEQEDNKRPELARNTDQAQAAGIDYASFKDLTQETEGLPYWAGHEKKIIGENGHLSIEIKYSNNGKSYTAYIEHGRETQSEWLGNDFRNCAGNVDRCGYLEPQVCTANKRPTSIFGGHVTKIIHESDPDDESEMGPKAGTGIFIDKELEILKTQFESCNKKRSSDDAHGDKFSTDVEIYWHCVTAELVAVKLNDSV